MVSLLPNRQSDVARDYSRETALRTTVGVANGINQTAYHPDTAKDSSGRGEAQTGN